MCDAKAKQGKAEQWRIETMAPLGLGIPTFFHCEQPFSLQSDAYLKLET